MGLNTLVKPRVTRPLMVFMAVGVVSIPLLDRVWQFSRSGVDATLGQILLGLLVLVLGLCLLVLGFIVRRNIRELDHEKNQLQTLFESMAEGVIVMASDGHIVQCNAQAEIILGLERDQLLGRHCLDPRWQSVQENGHNWSRDNHPAMVTLSTGQAVRQVIMGVRSPGGDLRWLSINTQAVMDNKGVPALVLASFTDVTSTRQQMERLDLTISGAGLGTWDWNIVTGQVVFNDIWADMLGYDLSEVAPDVSSWKKIVDPDAGGDVMRSLNEHLKGSTPIYRSEHRLRRKDGSWMWVLDTGRVVERDPDGKPLRALGVHVDITLTKQMEENLRVAKDRLLHATRNANLGVWDWNPQTDEAWFSERWFSMLGYAPDELPHTGSIWGSLMHPNDYESVVHTLNRYLDGDLVDEQSEFRLEFRMRCRDGAYNWILSVGRVTQRDEAGRPTRVSGVHFDETERKQVQAQRAQAQRLESIGQLAAGVAHEINTPMQFVSDNLEYLVEGLESAERLIDQVHQLVSEAKDGIPSTASEWLPRVLRDTGYELFRKQSAGAVRDCRDGCQRVVTIVHAMRQLSHPATDGFHLASLNEIISGAAIVTRNRWKFVADVRLELDPEIPNIPCRAAELSQVFVNMLVNSADALPEPPTGAALPSGVITIRSTLQNDQVWVTVQDNGIGIPAQVIDRIFDPFFTTKPFGQGTGQGLAIAHDIVVNRHRGALCVDSEPNRGTTFTIRLPLVQAYDHTAAEVAIV